MQIVQAHWAPSSGWIAPASALLRKPAQLVLLFGSGALLRQPEPLAQLRRTYPEALLFGCSTSGEIIDTRVHDDTLVATAIAFEHTTLRGTVVPIQSALDSFAAGRSLAQAFDPNGLVHVLLLSEGLHVNGSALVKGLTQHLPPHVSVTGGLAGDGSRFAETVVVWNGEATSGTVAAIGLYGDRLRVGYGSLGGWDSFGPDRLITRSENNVLYELDGTSALALYKRYLGEHAADLPASGLLFPLSISCGGGTERVVRTILAVNEAEQSITFAGDMPEGAAARLMKANFDRLVDGAIGAATSSSVAGHQPELALLISCVGRKLVLQQRVEEEVEGVRDVLGAQAALAGFYSYGEIAPRRAMAACALHNQTMTITTFVEI